MQNVLSLQSEDVETVEDTRASNNSWFICHIPGSISSIFVCP